MKRWIVCVRIKNDLLDVELLSGSPEAAERRAKWSLVFARKLEPEDVEVLGVHEERELTFDEVDGFGLDATGRDGDPRFPYKMSNLNIDERKKLVVE